ncbi:hypothetical protein [Candidatus Williamhamiltonella defendens]|uniref:hypothetical protein n=1 Tax=Candidatus Williamhamiltonella defendens TaxID=138072 RepID=UPI001F29F037|nr:hypothetical protein [Candidatus Hamiltonella defensa]
MQLISGDTTCGFLSLILIIQGLLIEKGGLTRSGEKRRWNLCHRHFRCHGRRFSHLKNAVTIRQAFLIRRY